MLFSVDNAVQQGKTLPDTTPNKPKSNMKPPTNEELEKVRQKFCAPLSTEQVFNILSQSKDKRKLAARKALLAGESFAEPGNRDAEMFALLTTIIRICPGIQEDQAIHLFLPSLSVWANEPNAEKTIDEEIEKLSEKFARASLEVMKEKTNEVLNDEFNKKYPFTDGGNSDLFVDTFVDKLRYVPERGKWLYYDGTHWEFADGKAMDLARQITKIRQDNAEKEPNPERQEQAYRWAKACDGYDRLTKMINLSRKQSRLHLSLSDCDKDMFLFNVKNGTIDLKTGTLLPFNPKHYITKQANFAYDSTATCPTFDKFFETIMPSQEIRDYIMRFFGYSLSGSTREQMMVIFWGGGLDGKSTLVEVVRDVISKGYMQTGPDTLLEKNRPVIPNDLAYIMDSRLVILPETEEGRKLNEAFIKKITGGDTLSVRFLNNEFFQAKPKFKLCMLTNNQPNIEGADKGIWRRIHLVHFRHSITERDMDIQSKLLAEGPGILKRLVEGALEYNKLNLSPPQTLLDDINSYKQEMDPILDFVQECCILGTSEKCLLQKIYAIYKNQWAFQQGAFALGKKRFKLRLASHGIVTKPGTDNQVFCYGVRLREQNEKIQTVAQNTDGKVINFPGT